MSYCVAMRLDAGIVFASDTRTNAGIDDVANAEKMRVYARPGERVIVTMRAGNMSVTQSALAWIDERSHQASAGEGQAETLMTVTTMAAAARLVGEALRAVDRRDGQYLRDHGVYEFGSFIVGGQIAGEPPRLFQVYSAGNVLETTQENIIFQIGEFKYGKPVLDRIVQPDMSIVDGATCALLSMDATMRSNLSVGPPLHVLAYAADSLDTSGPVRIVAADDYFQTLRQTWASGMRQLFATLPRREW